MPRRALLLFAASFLLAAGCQTQTRAVPGTLIAGPPPRAGPAPVAPREKIPGRDPTDPCATRLQDVTGELLEYFSFNHRLPAKLEDLATIAGPDSELNFTCPDSKAPYVYNPRGLQPPAGGDKRLIVYDSTPAHHGHRWGVVVGPALGNQASTMFVVDLSEAVFKTYLPPAEPPPAAP